MDQQCHIKNPITLFIYGVMNISYVKSLLLHSSVISTGTMFTISCTTIQGRWEPKKTAEGNALRMTMDLENTIKMQTSSRHPKFVKNEIICSLSLRWTGHKYYKPLVAAEYISD